MARKRGRPTVDNERRFELDEHDLADGITYEAGGLMRYHPEFHPHHRKPFTTGELVYVAKFADYDGYRSIGLALGRTDRAVKFTLAKLSKQGLLGEYKRMPLEEWERILEQEEKKNER